MDHSPEHAADEPEFTESRVRCVIRIRPAKGEGIMSVDGEKRLLLRERTRSANQSNQGTTERTAEYVYDRCFPSEASQAEIFLDTGLPLVEHVLLGCNACCFAYGQTGSGKTYSMFGAEGADWEKRGLIPRSVEYILDRAASMERSTGRRFQFTVSFLEIYLDKIRDLGRGAAGVLRAEKLVAEVANMSAMPQPGSLTRDRPRASTASAGAMLRRQRSVRQNTGALGGSSALNAMLNDSSTGPANQSVSLAMAMEAESTQGSDIYDSDNLEIMETKEGETFVNGLCQLEVQSVQDVMSVLTAGYALRKTTATLMNEVSSRSHTVFTLSVRSAMPDGTGFMKGRLNLCDLAGSERVKKSGSVGQTFKEAVHINQSLTALAKVILGLAVAANGDGSHIPYRDSKLTRLLKDSLAGNSYTTVLANVNPIKENHDESILTLNFASRCSSVIMKPKINTLVEEPVFDDRVQEFEEEVVTMQRDNDGRHVSSYQAVPKGMEVNRRMVSNAEATMGAVYVPGTGKGTTEIKGLSGSELAAQAMPVPGVSFEDQSKKGHARHHRRSSNHAPPMPVVIDANMQTTDASVTRSRPASTLPSRTTSDNDVSASGEPSASPSRGDVAPPEKLHVSKIRTAPERTGGLATGHASGTEEGVQRRVKLISPDTQRRLASGVGADDSPTAPLSAVGEPPSPLLGGMAAAAATTATPSSTIATHVEKENSPHRTAATSAAPTPIKPALHATPPPSTAKPAGATSQQMELLQFEVKRERDKVVIANKTIQDLQLEAQRLEQCIQDLRDQKSKEDIAHGQQLKAWRERVNGLSEQIQAYKNANKREHELVWQRTATENTRLKDDNARLKSMLAEITKTVQDLAEKRDGAGTEWVERERQIKENHQLKLAETIRQMESQRQLELAGQQEQFDRFMSAKEAEVLQITAESDRRVRNSESDVVASRRLVENFTSLIAQLEDVLGQLSSLNADGFALDQRNLQAVLQAIQKKFDLKTGLSDAEELAFTKITALMGVKRAIADARATAQSARNARPEPSAAKEDRAAAASSSVFYTMKSTTEAPKAGFTVGPNSLISAAELAQLAKRPRTELVGEIERYRKELVAERKRSQELLVALRSAQRTVDAGSPLYGGGRPNSAIPGGAMMLTGTGSRPTSAAFGGRPFSSQSQGRPPSAGVPQSPYASLVLSTRGVMSGLSGLGVGPTTPRPDSARAAAAGPGAVAAAAVARR